MGAVAQHIKDKYPVGSKHWVYVRDERPFARRGIGCGWRLMQVLKMGTQKVRLRQSGDSEDTYAVNIRRDDFLAMNPLTPAEAKAYWNRPLDGRKARRKHGNL